MALELERVSLRAQNNCDMCEKSQNLQNELKHSKSPTFSQNHAEFDNEMQYFSVRSSEKISKLKLDSSKIKILHHEQQEQTA